MQKSTFFEFFLAQKHSRFPHPLRSYFWDTIFRKNERKKILPPRRQIFLRTFFGQFSTNIRTKNAYFYEDEIYHRWKNEEKQRKKILPPRRQIFLYTFLGFWFQKMCAQFVPSSMGIQFSTGQIMRKMDEKRYSPRDVKFFCTHFWDIVCQKCEHKMSSPSVIKFIIEEIMSKINEKNTPPEASHFFVRILGQFLFTSLGTIGCKKNWGLGGSLFFRWFLTLFPRW